jgi:hypothetical protein
MSDKHTPSKQTMKAVKIRLMERDLSFSAYCRNKGYTRQNLAAALSGSLTGPKAEVLVRTVCEDLKLDASE